MVKPNPPQLGLAGLELPVFDRQARNLVVFGTPRSKAFVAADWGIGHWTVRGRVTRYGDWKTVGSTPAGDQTYGARTLLDASVSCDLDRWTFTLGGNNVTKVYPEKNNDANNYHGILACPLTSPFGFNGSHRHASAAHRW